MNDPTRTTAFNDSLRVLSQRYGFAQVRSTNGEVFIDMPLAAGGTFMAVLTAQQAKYLAINPLRAEDLKSKRLPQDWPKI